MVWKPMAARILILADLATLDLLFSPVCILIVFGFGFGFVFDCISTSWWPESGITILPRVTYSAFGLEGYYIRGRGLIELEH